jgi:XRE family transcriptional regulator, regulator of sulfur utilization
MAISLDKAAQHLARNITDLRKRKGLSQQKLALLSRTTRASIALLESGKSNPTLDILMKISQGLQVTIEEILSSPRAECQLVRSAEVPTDRRSKNGVQLRKLLPERIPATEMDELNLEPDTVLTGSPHIEGTREFFTCLKGEVLIGVLGEKFVLKKGDVLAFPGDKPHSYKNIGTGPAQGISVVLLTRTFPS